MGIRITTDDKGVKVYRSDKYDKPHYAVQISKKEGDGWVNHYQQIRFRKGIEVPDRCTIYIRDAFPTIYSWVKDDMQHVKEVWQIMEFDIDGQNVEPAGEESDSFAQVESDIPF